MEQTTNAEAGPVERRVRPVPEPVARLLRYAGQTMRTARSPNMTAREAITVGDWLAAMASELDDLRQQLWNEERQHDITRGDLARTRLACDELLAADDGRNVVIGGRQAPVAICTRMAPTDAQRERLAQKLEQAEYLIGAFERGADPADYGRDIAEFRA